MDVTPVVPDMVEDIVSVVDIMEVLEVELELVPEAVFVDCVDPDVPLVGELVAKMEVVMVAVTVTVSVEYC